MTVRVITIEREFGCGAQIAKLLADDLGWKLWDQLLTTEIARLAECDRCEVEQREERTDPLYYRLLKSVLRGSFEGSLNVHRLKMLDADSIFKLTEHVVQEAAAQGKCVIVGRGSAFFLQNWDDAFHVFLYAPYEDKVTRLVESGTDKEEAGRLIETVDQDRASFIKKYFGQDWPNRHLYHLMINSHAGDEAVVQTIRNAIMTLQKHPIEGSFPA
jgi:cytidylate kinase